MASAFDVELVIASLIFAVEARDPLLEWNL
jgi:hypothetical protein